MTNRNSAGAVPEVDKHKPLRKAADNPGAVTAKEPVALYGLIAFIVAAAVLVVAVTTKQGIMFAALPVMLAQLYFTRKSVFSPSTVLKFLRVR